MGSRKFKERQKSRRFVTKMKHYHLECNYGYNDCINCPLLKDCFPKTYKLRMKAIDKKWKDKYGDEF